MKDQFVWGVASSAFQIEGAWNEDGKGLSIWDVYTHIPGKIKGDATGDVACDHYHRYHEDVALMEKLGVKAYRFSVSWARILPDGDGKPNEQGLLFYNNLINELLAHGIEPYLTLYHWDLPQKLFQRGGWLNPDIPEIFYRYARLIGERFGDRVKTFMTINEPQNVLEGMCPGGTNAPALAYSLRDRLAAVHNVLKSHGRAVQALRETVSDVKIGFAPCCTVVCPANDDPTLVNASREELFRLGYDDFKGASLYSDPVFLGDYPKEYYKMYADILPEITPGDMELISQPIDFCFQNIYTGWYSELDESGNIVPRKGRVPYNSLGWPVVPEALYWGPRFFYERYGKPVFISENGYVGADSISLDGKVHDSQRVDFIVRYTSELFRARTDGVDIRGYFYWTIMDNLEWELGYEPRFGLVYVDFDTLERIPKDSFYAYQKLIVGN